MAERRIDRVGTSMAFCVLRIREEEETGMRG